MASPQIPAQDLESFTAHLKQSRRILALCGAGLSAASGLPTFRGAGGLWRSHDATSLATPEAFEENPGLVWQFYSYRRHMSLQAQPNAGHYALAELANRNPRFQTLTQNVDGLSPRAGHPASTLHMLHGSLFDVKCFKEDCIYLEKNNSTDPIFPALAIPTSTTAPAPLGTASSGALATESLEKAMNAAREAQSTGQELDISDDRVEIAHLTSDDIPKCPQCGEGYLRPGVVWFGEALPGRTLRDVNSFISESPVIDLMLVIGTSGQVYPAAAYVEVARRKGAKVAVINMDAEDLPGRDDERRAVDWFFQGDAAQILPEILKEVIGKPEDYMPDPTEVT